VVSGEAWGIVICVGENIAHFEKSLELVEKNRAFE
jgi:hypothetical protein